MSSRYISEFFLIFEIKKVWHTVKDNFKVVKNGLFLLWSKKLKSKRDFSSIFAYCNTQDFLNYKKVDRKKNEIKNDLENRIIRNWCPNIREIDCTYANKQEWYFGL